MQHVKNEAGYTLIEALFHLTTVSLFIFMSTIFFQWYEKTNNQVTNINDLKWRQFSLDFQREIRRVSPDFSISYPGKNFDFHNGEDRISIHFINGVIRKQINGSGHIPLLTDVKQRNIQYKNGVIQFSVVFNDGLEREGEFILGVYEE